MKHGDFSHLAKDYSSYRPKYSETVLDALLGLIDKPVDELDVADVGAGTGIWTRMLANRNCGSIIAVEPNDSMREYGIRDSQGWPIEWRQGRGEDTGLETSSIDLLTMASSFHWLHFEDGVDEFQRVLKPGGRFVSLWNSRLIEANPLLVEIENHLYEMLPDLKRVSSGRSGLAETLTEQLITTQQFDDVVFLEGRHVERQTPAHYLGIWRSVNDVRVQAGEKAFHGFMDYIENRINGMEHIEATYLTRAWAARRS